MRYSTKEVERFWAKVEKLSGCWNWQGGRTGPFGAFRFGGRPGLAHRFSWLLSHGEGGFTDRTFVIVQTCDNKLCVKPGHLARVHKSATMELIAPRDRFWNLVEIPEAGGDVHWLWRGSKNNKGYGQFHLGGGSRHVLAHRFAYELTHGSVPPGLIVMHDCDTPACVNPEHLLAGTNAQNQRDMALKGRAGNRGERSPGAKLSEPIVQTIRVRAADGETCASLAKEFRVSHTLIRGVINRSRWRHVA